MTVVFTHLFKLLSFFTLIVTIGQPCLVFEIWPRDGRPTDGRTDVGNQRMSGSRGALATSEAGTTNLALWPSACFHVDRRSETPPIATRRSRSLIADREKRHLSVVNWDVLVTVKVSQGQSNRHCWHQRRVPYQRVSRCCRLANLMEVWS